MSQYKIKARNISVSYTHLDEKELVSEIVGMTNTEGGVLYLGVEDNGDITGVHLSLIHI